MENILYVICFFIIFFGSLAFAIAILAAPAGKEDENGFHREGFYLLTIHTTDGDHQRKTYACSFAQAKEQGEDMFDDPDITITGIEVIKFLGEAK